MKDIKSGFTLAEILIALLIIAIVATLTIPAIMQSYFEKITETRLVKFYTMMNQAIQLSSIENGAPENWEFEYLERDEENNAIDKSEISSVIFDRYLGKYIKIVREERIYDNEHSRYTNVYFLPDGSAFAYPPHTNIDIHYFPYKPKTCLKKENNTKGTCRFHFFFAADKAGEENYLYASKTGISAYVYAWDGDKSTLYKGGTYPEGCDLSEGGGYCSQLIAINGWKVPKDYPRKISY